MKKLLYLNSWIDFGKYRKTPTSLKKIIDTEDGRHWLRWMISESYLFSFSDEVIKYLEEKSAQNGQLLQ